MIISLRLNNTDAQLIKCFADHNGYTVSAFLRMAVLDYIERNYVEISSLKEVGSDKKF